MLAMRGCLRKLNSQFMCWCVLENQLKVSEKSGNFVWVDCWQPCKWMRDNLLSVFIILLKGRIKCYQLCKVINVRVIAQLYRTGHIELDCDAWHLLSNTAGRNHLVLIWVRENCEQKSLEYDLLVQNIGFCYFV